jgi:hypothetical protein
MEKSAPFVEYGKEEAFRDDSMHSGTIEPEMEDCNDTMLLKNLIKELGIEEIITEDVDPLKHNVRDPDVCVHCKLLRKLTALQTDITKMNQEICATHEILSLKKDQNSDLKNMIKRLEGNLGKVHDEMFTEKSAAACSCTNRCLIC